MIKIAINGFGRIGRRVFRLALQNPIIEIITLQAQDLAPFVNSSQAVRSSRTHCSGEMCFLRTGKTVIWIETLRA